MSRARIFDILIAGVCVALLALSGVTNGNHAGHLAIEGKSLGNTCTFHRITTVKCPFCGITRSMVALLDGRIHDSLQFHPLGVCLASAFALTAIAVIVAAARRSAPVIETSMFSAVMLPLIVANLCLWAFDEPRHCWLPESNPTKVVE